jgi:dTDP-4-amino-4,6-dideoxygalactose transaminase
VGGSYVPSEIASAFLFGQLELLDEIAARRRALFEFTREHLQSLEDEGLLRLPIIPEGCEPNYHLFHILLPDTRTRDGLLAYLKQESIHAVFHYVPLHSSPMGQKFGYREGDLPVTEDLSGRLLRLPLYYAITPDDQFRVIQEVQRYLKRNLSQHRQVEPLATLAE